MFVSFAKRTNVMVWPAVTDTPLPNSALPKLMLELAFVSELRVNPLEGSEVLLVGLPK